MDRAAMSDDLPSSLLETIHNRELGHRNDIYRHLEDDKQSKSVQRRINSEFNDIAKKVHELRAAVKRNHRRDIEHSVGDVIMTLLDSANPNSLYQITPKRRQQRELFVSLGGFDLLLQLFNKPFGASDARLISSVEMSLKSEIWNEILVVLREIVYAMPGLAEKGINDSQIVFLFTLLRHQSVFDNAMNLLEEILAAQRDTFSLILIPDLFSLLDGFSSRQLAHFCRVLSLVLFEPEDRQIMEGTQVLRSMDLLNLRRNRMMKTIGGAVERNQSLIIEMPGMLSRLIQILRVINYGPPLADLISHNIVTQTPITSDILQFVSSASGISDWDHFSSLEKLIRDDRAAKEKAMAAMRNQRESAMRLQQQQQQEHEQRQRQRQSPNAASDRSASEPERGMVDPLSAGGSGSSSPSRRERSASADLTTGGVSGVTGGAGPRTRAMQERELERQQANRSSSPSSNDNNINNINRSVGGVGGVGGANSIAAGSVSGSSNAVVSRREYLGDGVGVTRDSSSNTSSSSVAAALLGNEHDDDIMSELLQAFSPGARRGGGTPAAGAGAAVEAGVTLAGGGVGGGGGGAIEEDEDEFSGGMGDDTNSLQLMNLIRVMEIAQRLGIAQMTPLGQSLIFSQPNLQPDMFGDVGFNNPPTPPSAINAGGGGGAGGNMRTYRRNRGRFNADLNQNNPKRAKKELQFHALMLAPHQIELIFVLCTLMSGRRKISIQKTFAELGLAEVMRRMYDRMSWDSPAFSGWNPMDHLHGPGCECNPESAVRVQFLRLIHNFYDRDFLGNPNKLLMLSDEEIDNVRGIEAALDRGEDPVFASRHRHLILPSASVDQRSAADATASYLVSYPTSYPTSYPAVSQPGLLMRIISTLMKEPSDSVYRFWLSSCVENFLRGCGRAGQIFVAESGLLRHTVQQILCYKPADKKKGSGGGDGDDSGHTLQTCFDLLGELVKCNLSVLELLEDCLVNFEPSTSAAAALTCSPQGERGGVEAALTDDSVEEKEISEIKHSNKEREIGQLKSSALEVTASVDDVRLVEFCNRIMKNLVDSNVFLRGAYLSMEFLFPYVSAEEAKEYYIAVDQQQVQQHQKEQKQAVDEDIRASGAMRLSSLINDHQRSLALHGFCSNSLRMTVEETAADVVKNARLHNQIILNPRDSDDGAIDVSSAAPAERERIMKISSDDHAAASSAFGVGFPPSQGYLTSTWVQFSPAVLSARAVTIFKEPNAVDVYVADKIAERKYAAALSPPGAAAVVGAGSVVAVGGGAGGRGSFRAAMSAGAAKTAGILSRRGGSGNGNNVKDTAKVEIEPLTGATVARSRSLSCRNRVLPGDMPTSVNNSSNSSRNGSEAVVSNASLSTDGRADVVASSSSSSAGSSSSAFAQLGSGVMGAWKDIRQATTHFLKFSTAEEKVMRSTSSAAASLDRPAILHHGKNPSSKTPIDLDGQDSRAGYSSKSSSSHIDRRSSGYNSAESKGGVSAFDDEYMFFTPPEEPHFSRNSSAPAGVSLSASVPVCDPTRAHATVSTHSSLQLCAAAVPSLAAGIEAGEMPLSSKELPNADSNVDAGTHQQLLLPRTPPPVHDGRSREEGWDGDRDGDGDCVVILKDNSIFSPDDVLVVPAPVINAKDRDSVNAPVATMDKMAETAVYAEGKVEVSSGRGIPVAEPAMEERGAAERREESDTEGEFGEGEKDGEEEFFEIVSQKWEAPTVDLLSENMQQLALQPGDRAAEGTVVIDHQTHMLTTSSPPRPVPSSSFSSSSADMAAARRVQLIPPTVRKLFAFLHREKLNVLLQLMSTVSLRSINHENICCLNTALSMLILDHSRGCLAETLAQIGKMANEQSLAKDYFASKKALVQSERKEAALVREETTTTTTATAASEVSKSPVASDAALYCLACAPPLSNTEQENSVESDHLYNDQEGKKDELAGVDEVRVTAAADMDPKHGTETGISTHNASSLSPESPLQQNQPLEQEHVIVDGACVQCNAGTSPFQTRKLARLRDRAELAPSSSSSLAHPSVVDFPAPKPKNSRIWRKTNPFVSRGGIFGQRPCQQDTRQMVQSLPAMPTISPGAKATVIATARTTTSGASASSLSPSEFISDRDTSITGSTAQAVERENKTGMDKGNGNGNGKLPSIRDVGDGVVDAAVDATGEAKPTTTAAEAVFRNFRELLWYWQEYYLRRGRDRLSIEFSSHIPFHEWLRIVDLLSKDDGAPTSLLAQPMAMPRSPYQQPKARTVISCPKNNGRQPAASSSSSISNSNSHSNR